MKAFVLRLKNQIQNLEKANESDRENFLIKQRGIEELIKQKDEDIAKLTDVIRQRTGFESKDKLAIEELMQTKDSLIKQLTSKL